MNECLARLGSLENSFAGLKTSVVQLETKLGTVIEERFQHFEKHLERMESSLTAKLDKIDEDIRGNGKDGINVRLDRLEIYKKFSRELKDKKNKEEAEIWERRHKRQINGARTAEDLEKIDKNRTNSKT